MPKMKTHRGTKKRVKVTGTGKIVLRHSGKSHILTKKSKKRKIRELWIIRINAAARLNGVSYSKFMDGLKKSGIELDRKVLADLAVNNAGEFSKLVELVKN